MEDCDNVTPKTKVVYEKPSVSVWYRPLLTSVFFPIFMVERMGV